MPRADGPVMPSPRAGMAMVRESSSQTTARARIDMPPPPYSSGTSSCQIPKSLARCSKRARWSGLMRSPSVVWRSIGISSLSTKRRRPALRIRSSSGNSKSMPSYSLPPHHAYVDCDRAGLFGAAPRSHHERIDLDVLYFRAVIEEETAERKRGRLERGAIGRGPPAKARQQPDELEAVDHRADLVRRHRQEPQRGVLDQLDQNAARAHEQHRPEIGRAS